MNNTVTVNHTAVMAQAPKAIQLPTMNGTLILAEACSTALRSQHGLPAAVIYKDTSVSWPAVKDVALTTFHSIMSLLLLPTKWYLDDTAKPPSSSVLSSLFPITMPAIKYPLPGWLRCEYELKACLYGACTLSAHDTYAPVQTNQMSAYVKRGTTTPSKLTAIDVALERKKNAVNAPDNGRVWDYCKNEDLANTYKSIHKYVHDCRGWQHQDDTHLFALQAPLFIRDTASGIRVMGFVLAALRQSLRQQKAMPTKNTGQFRSGTWELFHKAKEWGLTNLSPEAKQLASAYLICSFAFANLMYDFMLSHLTIEAKSRRTRPKRTNGGDTREDEDEDGDSDDDDEAPAPPAPDDDDKEGEAVVTGTFAQAGAGTSLTRPRRRGRRGGDDDDDDDEDYVP